MCHVILRKYRASSHDTFLDLHDTFLDLHDTFLDLHDT